MPSAIIDAKPNDIRVVLVNSGRRKLAVFAELLVRKLGLVFQAASPSLTAADSLFVSSLFAMLALRLSAKDTDDIQRAGLAVNSLVSEITLDAHQSLNSPHSLHRPLFAAVAQHLMSRPLNALIGSTDRLADTEAFTQHEFSELHELLDVPTTVSGLGILVSDVILFLDHLDANITFTDLPELTYALTAISKKESLLDTEDGLSETEVTTQIRDTSNATQIAEVKPDATSLGSSSLTSLAKMGGSSGGGGMTATTDGGGGASGGGFGGRVVDGYVVGATVFYDANNNGILDQSEALSATVTDKSGNFTLGTFTQTDVGKVVILPGGVDSNTGQTVGAFQTDLMAINGTQRAISSPLSLILTMQSDLLSEADLIAQLGISGVESGGGIFYYDPITEMASGTNSDLAEKVFTVQQQIFSIIQAGAVIAGESSGLNALDISVEAVALAISDAVASGESITIDQIADSAITKIALESGYSQEIADYMVDVVCQANAKIASSYVGLASALQDTSDTDNLTIISAAKAAAAVSQETLLVAVEAALTSESVLSAEDFTTSVASAIEEKSAVFDQVLAASNSSTKPTSDYGNPSYLVSQALADSALSAASSIDILDIASEVAQLTLAQTQSLGIEHLQLLGSNLSLEMELGTGLNYTTFNESGNLFAKNYKVTLRISDSQVSEVVTNAAALVAAGVDTIRPDTGSLVLSVSNARSLIDEGLSFSPGLVRIEADSSLTFNDICTLFASGLKFTDSSDLSVSIPANDPRATFAFIQDLASKGVKFTGGEITLLANDVLGAVGSVQSKLLQAAESGLTFNNSELSSWTLGKSLSGSALARPLLTVDQAVTLAEAGVSFYNAKLALTTGTVDTLVANASTLLQAGVREVSIPSGVTLTVAQAQTLVEAKTLLTQADSSAFTGSLFSGMGTLSDAGSLSLSSLNSLISEGVSLPAGYSLTYAQVVDFVNSGGSFPGTFTLSGSSTVVSGVTEAQTLINAGVKFASGARINLSSGSDTASTDATDATLFTQLAKAGLTLDFGGNTSYQTLTGSDSNPLWLTRSDAQYLASKGVLFSGAGIGASTAADLVLLASEAATWQQAGITHIGMTSSLAPSYSQIQTLVSSGFDLSRVFVTTNGLVSSDASFTLRITSAADLAKITLDASVVTPSALKSAGVDVLDLLGLTLTLDQAKKFLAADTSTSVKLTNAQVAISSAAEFDYASANGLALFEAGVSSFNLVSSSSWNASVSAGLADDLIVAYKAAYDTTFVPSAVFSGGTIASADGVANNVGSTISELVGAGFKLASGYTPSKAEILEFLQASSTNKYNKPVTLAALPDGESLSVSDANLMASRGIKFASGIQVSITSYAVGEETDQIGVAPTEQVQAQAYQTLIGNGLSLTGLTSSGSQTAAGTLAAVSLTYTQAKNLLDAGFKFSGDSTLLLTNSIELRNASLLATSFKTSGFANVAFGSGVVPTFDQASNFISSGLAFTTASSINSSSDIKITVSSPLQLSASSFSATSFAAAGVDVLDLSGQKISWASAQKFVSTDTTAVAGILLSNAVLSVSADELVDASSKVQALYAAGLRSIALPSDEGVNAAFAQQFLNVGGDTSKDFAFTGGQISSSEGVSVASLPTTLAELKAAGLVTASTFRPSYDISARVPAASNDQADAKEYVSLLAKGFDLTRGNSPNADTISEATLSNVYLTLAEANQLLADADVSLINATVVVSSQSQISSVASAASTLKAGGVNSVGLALGFTPSFDEAKVLAQAGLHFDRLTSSTVNSITQYAPATDSTKLALRLNSSADLALLNSTLADQLKAQGIDILNLTGLSVPESQAGILLNKGFTFSGGQLSDVPAAKNNFNALASYAAAGLSLPSTVSAQNSVISYDFAVNNYKGSLDGAQISLSGGPQTTSKTTITGSEVLSLIGRGLDTSASTEAGLINASNTALTLTATTTLSETQALSIGNAGITRVSGNASVATALAMTKAKQALSSIELSDIRAAGTASLDQAIALDSAGITMNSSATSGVTVDLARQAISLNDALRLTNESGAGAGKNVLAFTNGNLQVSSASVISATQAGQLKSAGLRTLEVSGTSPLSPNTLDALNSVSNTNGFKFTGVLNPTQAADLVSYRNLSVSEASVAGTTNLANALTLAIGQFSLAKVQIDLGADALTLSQLKTLTSGTSLGSGLTGTSKAISTSQNGGVAAVTLSAADSALAVTPEFSLNLKTLGLASAQGQMTMAQSLAFIDQGLRLSNITLSVDATALKLTTTQAIALQAAGIGLPQDVTIGANQTASLADALKLASWNRFSIDGLKVTSGTPTVAQAMELLDEKASLGSISLAAGETASVSQAATLAAQNQLNLTGLLLSSGSVMTPTQAVSLGVDRGVSLFGVTIRGEANVQEGQALAALKASAPNQNFVAEYDVNTNTAPTLQISSNKSAIKSGESATITFTFSQDPGSSFSASDVTVNGGTLSGLSGSGRTRTATFTPTANTGSRNASIIVADGAYADRSGNLGTGAISSLIPTDTLAPSLTITSNKSKVGVGQTATITFTFSEDPGTTFTNNDVVVSNGSLGTISGTGLTRTAFFTPSANLTSGSTSITVLSNSFTDAAGNSGRVSGSVPSISIDTVAPVISSGATGSVAENEASSTVIYSAAASDADAVGTLSYSLTGADSGLLEINASTGAVTLKASADYESQASYSFNVVASDGTNSSSQAVVVAVTNVNESPVFSSNTYTANFADTAAQDIFSSVTGTFIASDTDAVSTLTYGISGGVTSGSTVTKTGTFGTLSLNTETGAYTFEPNSTSINALTTSTTESFAITVGDGANTVNVSYMVTLVGTNEAPQNSFNTTISIAPGTGGTITRVGTDYVHSFTTVGASTFVAPSANVSAQVLVVGGGGGGGFDGAGGGGGGGVVYSPDTALVSSTTYSVNVGAGGFAGTPPIRGLAGAGGSSSFGLSLTALGGGAGGDKQSGGGVGANGGGGGHGGSYAGGAGTHGYSGGAAVSNAGGGGGGAGGAGQNASNNLGGNGGLGIANDIFDTTQYYGGGGAGGSWSGSGGTGGSGGGGNGGGSSSTSGISGSANTGGGGGSQGNAGSGSAGSGGSGIVIVRYAGLTAGTTTTDFSAQSVSAIEDTAMAIRGIQVSDSDSAILEVNFSHSAGTLSVKENVTNGLTSDAITGNGSATLTLTGTVAQINTTLAASSGLVYTPTPDFNGNATLTMTTSDGAGGSDVDNFNMIVSATPDVLALKLAADTGSSSTDGITNEALVHVTGLEINATWQYQVDSGSWVTGSGDSFSATPGEHTYAVRQTVDGVVSIASSNISLTYIPAASKTIEFDFYRLASWDGEIFSIAINDEVLVNKDFYHAPEVTDSSSNSISEGLLSGLGYELTSTPGTFIAQDLRFEGTGASIGSWYSQKYHIAITLPEAAGSITLGLYSTLDQDKSDEAWAIDNFATSIFGRDTQTFDADSGDWVARTNGQSIWDSSSNSYINGGLLGLFDNASTGASVQLFFNPLVALGTGVSDGTTTAEATSASGVVTVQAQSGVLVDITFTGTNGSLVKTVTGAGASIVPVALSIDDLTTLGNGMVSVVAADKAGNSVAAGQTSFVLTNNTSAATPLILDLNHDGVHTLDANAGVRFDITASGHSPTVGWASKADGFLVRDINGDGVINSGAEMFGEATLLSNGSQAQNGFEALADLDLNQDGVVNSQDATFGSLAIWRDANSNGLTDAGELLSLAQQDIASLNLNAASSDRVEHGNQLALVSSYTTTNGVQHEMVDVWLSTIYTAGTDLNDTSGAITNPLVSDIYFDTGSGTLLAQGAGQTLEFSLFVSTPMGIDSGGTIGIELSADASRSSYFDHVDLTGTGDNALNISVADVLYYSGLNADSQHQLVVDGDAGDSVLAIDWQRAAGTVSNGGQTYNIYSPLTTDIFAQLLVDTDISVKNNQGVLI